MHSINEILSSIIQILSRYPEGRMMKDLAAELDLNRNAVAKYTGILFQQGRVDIRYIGRAKIFTLSKRIPFSILTEISPDYIISTDRNLHCVDANARFSAWAGCTTGEIRGKPIQSLPVPLFQRTMITDLVRAGISAISDPVRISLTLQNREYFYEIQSVPVVFSDCTTGSALIIKDITDSETVAEKIFILEERYRALTGAQSEFIVHSLPDGTILFANPAFSDLTGTPSEHLVGKKIRLKIPEADLTAVRQHFRSICYDDPNKSIEHRVLANTGEVRWIRWKNLGIFRDERLTEYHSYGTDITELKTARNRLQYYHDNTEKMVREKTDELTRINRDLLLEIQKRKQIERNLQKTQFCVNNSSDMILWADETGTVTSLNKSALSTLRIHPGDILIFMKQGAGAPLQQIPWQEIWESAKQNGFILFEAFMHGRSERPLPVEVLVNFLFFDDSESCCFFVRDITERKQWEDRLRLLEISVESAYDEVFWMDMAGNFLYVNDAACRTTGYSQKELCAMNIRDLVPNLLPEQLVEHVADARKNKRQFFLSRHRCKNGTIIDVEVGSVHVMRGEEGHKICFARDITERKAAEDMLKLLKTSVDSAYDEVFWMDSQANILYANDAACNTTGYSEEELCAMNIFTLDPDFTPEIWERSIEGLRKNKKQIFQTRHRRKDGVILDVEIGLVYSTHGSMEYVFCFVRNIAENRQMAMALRESDEMFATAFYRGPLMLSIMEIGTYIYMDVNDQFTRVSGYSRDEIIGKTAPEVGWIDPEEWESIIGELKRTGRVAGRDMRLTRKGGEPVWCRYFGEIITGAGKNRLLSLTEDITDKKLAEGALHESKLRYQRIFESFVDTYCETDAMGIIRVMSPSVYALTGWKPEELAGKSILHLYTDPRDRQALIEGLEHSPVASGFEVKLKKRDGTPVFVSINVRQRYGISGEPDGMAGSIRDITNDLKRPRADCSSTQEKKP
ncbi:MAG: PAS domain S-box protein [Methanoregula sp.]|jgi:PAS domain S-box-containing protein|nr:PAS domain S-box protein [Methanoregula sp.]